MQDWKARHGGLAWQEKKYKKIKFGLSAFFLLISIIKSLTFLANYSVELYQYTITL